MIRILWVDDDCPVIMGLMRPLEKAGHVIDAARTVAAALEKLHSGAAYDLAIVDIFIPLGEAMHAPLPDAIKSAGDNVGGGLILHMRQELGLRMPIVVMSVAADDRQIVDQLEACEIAEFLAKGTIRPDRLKQVVERALDEVDFERATRLNLCSRHYEERKAGLNSARKMPPTPTLRRALARLRDTETAPELRALAESILATYPPDDEPDWPAREEPESPSVDQRSPFKYDVFLSHNSADRIAVEFIAHRLRQAGLHPFLDKWHLVPGERWQEALEEALGQSASVAVFFGPSGVSPWHNEELRAALDQAMRVREGYRVIPVLLPGADEAAIGRFLARRTWVDFRPGLDDAEAFRRLLAGINGQAPGPAGD
jgi:CheY-like chemotaxis protein